MSRAARVTGNLRGPAHVCGRHRGREPDGRCIPVLRNNPGPLNCATAVVSERPAALAVSARAREGEDAYRQLAEVYNHLTALALQGADVATVTGILAERMSQAVAVLEASLEPLTMCV